MSVDRRRMAAALLVSLGTTAVVLVLHGWYPSRAFTFLYLPMVAAIAFVGGRRAGVVGAAAGILGAWYVLFGPGRQAAVDTGLVVFMGLFAASVVVLEEAMGRLRLQTLASQSLAAIVESSDDAIFSKSLDATILTWNRGAERMYGYRAAEAIGRPVSMLAPPETGDDVPGIMARLARGERIERYESVRMRKDGTRFDVSLTLSPIRDGLGRVIGASTIAHDISDRRRVVHQQQFLIEATDLFASSLSVRDLLQALSSLVVPRLADWCTIDLLDDAGDPQILTVVHGDPAKVAVARQLQARLENDPRARRARRRVIETGRSELHEEISDEVLTQAVTDPAARAAIRGLGLRSSLTVPLPARGRVIGAMSFATAESGRRYGPTDRAFAEQLAHRAALAVDNARLHEAEGAARRTAERVAGRIERLQAFTAALSEAVTPEQVGDLTLRHAASELGAGGAAVCLVGEDGAGPALISAFGYSPRSTERWRREPGRIRPLAEAMRTAGVVWFPSWPAFAARYPDAEPPEEAVRAGARAAVPLMLHGRAVGVLYMNFADERRFGPEELELMLTLGRQCAQAVERARLYAREHQVATTLQRALLPVDVPEVPGIRVDAAYAAATRAADVGGDWYDVFRLPDGRLCLAIGDVVGHGLQAAVIMGQVRQAVRTASLEGHTPPAVLALANHLLHLNGQGEMTTAVVGFLDPLRLTLTYATAGHPGPILARADGVETLRSGGLPLGFLDETDVPDWTVPLPRGALLVLYTDGLIEFARDAIAGHAALEAAARDERAAGSLHPAHRILDLVLSGAEARDDIAVVAVAVAAGPLDRLDVTVPAEPSSLRLVRQALQQLCAGVGLDERRSFDLGVAVGEAVNNAVEHAYGVTPGTVRLRAYRDGGTLRVEIEDAGRWRPDRPNSPGGRGFTLMRALVDDVQVATGEKGTAVRLAIGLTPAPASASAGTSGAAAVPYSATRDVRVGVRAERGAPVVELAGDLDISSVGRLTAALDRAAADTPGLVVVSLGAVSYFDSQGIRALLRAHRQFRAGRSRLAVVAPPGSPVRALLEIAGLATSLPVFDTVAEALGPETR